jgi:hypothetical protein
VSSINFAKLKIFKTDMKIKNVSLLFALFGFLSMLGIGCGSGNVDDSQGEGIVYDTLPVFEKDSFLYPLASRSSGYVFPEIYYGDIKAIDGDLSSGWHTIPGLVTGEYIEFEFDSLYVSAIEVFPGTELRYAQFKNVKIYLENKLFGTFSPLQRIPIGRKINTFRLELGETDGTNKVDIPFKNDSTQLMLTESITSESIYASKSAAIFEIVFFDEQGGLPIRSLPVKKAKMNFYGVEEPRQMNNSRLLFDGSKAFGWKGPAEAEEKTLLFSFEEDQVINGLFFPFTEKLNLTKIGFRLRKRALPEYEIKPTAGNGILVTLKNTLKGKNFELVILETKNDEAPFIPELLFHDGSRLFSIYSDSLAIYRDQRIDSSKNTPIAHYMDSRIVTVNKHSEFAHPLNVIFSKKKTITDTLALKSNEVECIFRLCSNGTFIINETRKEQRFGEEPAWESMNRAAEGYWVVKSKSATEATITCYTDLKENQILSRGGKENVERTNTKAVIFDVTLSKNYISFSQYFSGMTTGY